MYASARQDALVVAVECATPAATCFCTSMGGGPEVQAGADLVLTELLDGEHRFLAQAETDVGRDLLARLPDTVLAHHADGEQRAAVLQGAGTGSPGTSTPMACTTCCSATSSTHAGTRSPSGAWPAAAARSCARPASARRSRTPPTSRVPWPGTTAGGRPASSCPTRTPARAASAAPTRARYRQWLTHKLATWVDQFDSSGCVGCGRCITWCPVGIDITEEVAAIGTP